jgi:hypothetical protein
VALHRLFDDAAELMALHHGGVPQINGRFMVGFLVDLKFKMN